MFKNFRWMLVLFTLAVFLLGTGVSAFAQRLDGTLRGEVRDPTGAVIAGAKVTATNQATGVAQTTDTTSAGVYIFPNLLVGSYTLNVEAPGFRTYQRRNIEVRSNQTVEANPTMAVGAPGEVMEVTAGAEVIQTTTSQLANTWSEVSLQSFGGNVLNLAATVPNTTTMTGGVLGSGGSVGGTRPRMNSFSIDGLDNNNVSVTGPNLHPIKDSIAEFTLITNKFDAEHGHSAGGQFAIITRSGTNNVHGSLFWLTQNRKFNALDNLQKAGGFTADTKPRFDFNNVGGSVGGPIIRDRVFLFGAFDYATTGQQGSSVLYEAPTAAGLTALQGLAVNNAVQTILSEFPTAAAETRSVVANRRDAAGNIVASAPVGIGTITSLVPSFDTQYRYNINADVNLSNQQIRGRYFYNRFRAPSTARQPQFSGALTFDAKTLLVSDVITVTPRFLVELKAGASRLDGTFLRVPDQFVTFPNVTLPFLSNFTLGPVSNAPQGGITNSYQYVMSMSYVAGAHTVKWGGEGRNWTGQTDFLPRARGDWFYADFDQLVGDFLPTTSAIRGAGSGAFDRNQWAFFGFVQDDWKVNSRVTLNLGMRYEFTTVPNGAKTQALNSVATLPGSPLVFNEPRSEKYLFAPRVGFAWDPTGAGQWAVRGGYGIAYDVTFQNLPLLSLPPQLQSEMRAAIACTLSPPPGWCANYNGAIAGAGGYTGQGFLATGDLPGVLIPPANQAQARARTQGVIPDQAQPRVDTWTLSIQRELYRGASLETRYLGTRSSKMPVQRWVNHATAFQNGATPLPLYFSTSEIPATVAGTAPNLQQFVDLTAFANFPNNLPYGPDGFAGVVTTFAPTGEGDYHALSLDYIQRMQRGISMRANWTWAKNIDNSTNELFSSLVNPRRPEDHDNMRAERGRSVLDHRHKLAVSWTYEIPRISTDSGALRAILHGWDINGIYIAQAGQPITALSFGQSANGNGDSVATRAVLNPNGSGNTGSGTSFVCRDAGTGATSVAASAADCGGNVNVVGYVANDPSARFIQARPGVITNTGRNNLDTPGLNNWDLALFKKTNITEQKYVEFRWELFNAFNHRQFTYASSSVFQRTAPATGAFSPAVVDNANFMNFKVLSGGARTMQFGLRFIF